MEKCNYAGTGNVVLDMGLISMEKDINSEMLISTLSALRIAASTAVALNFVSNLQLTRSWSSLYLS